MTTGVQTTQGKLLYCVGIYNRNLLSEVEAKGHHTFTRDNPYKVISVIPADTRRTMAMKTSKRKGAGPGGNVVYVPV